MPTADDLKSRYAAHGQSHVFAGWDRLTEAERTAFLAQLEDVDLGLLAELHRKRGQVAAALPSREYIDPLPVVDAASVPASAKTAGELALWNGEGK